MYYSGRRSKQRIQGQRIIFEGKGPNGWNNNILLLHFSYWPEIQKSANLIYQHVFCWTVISHQSFSPFPSTSVEALGLFTFLPQSTVHNLRISELGFFYILIPPLGPFPSKMMRCPWVLCFDLLPPQYTDMAVPGLCISWYPIYFIWGIHPPLVSSILYLCHISTSNIQYILSVAYIHHLYLLNCTCGIYPTLGPGIPEIESPGIPPNTRKLPL